MRGHQVDEYAKQTSDLAWPILANLGFSGVCGVAVAVALKVGSAGEAPSCCVRG